MWGLDAPQQVDVRASRNPYADMTEDALREALVDQARLLGIGGPEPAEPLASTGEVTDATR